MMSLSLFLRFTVFFVLLVSSSNACANFRFPLQKSKIVTLNRTKEADNCANFFSNAEIKSLWSKFTKTKVHAWAGYKITDHTIAFTNTENFSHCSIVYVKGVPFYLNLEREFSFEENGVFEFYTGDKEGGYPQEFLKLIRKYDLTRQRRS